LLFLAGRVVFHHVDGARGRSDGGAPSVLIAYGDDDADRLAESGLDGAFVPLGNRQQMVLVYRPAPAQTWLELLSVLVERQGGRISLSVAYALVGKTPKAAANQHYEAKIRQVLQGPRFRRVGRGEYQLALDMPA